MKVVKRRRRLSWVRLGLVIAGFGCILWVLWLLLWFGIVGPLSRHVLGYGNPPLVIVGDTNRDGAIAQDDWRNRNAWTWQSGAFLLANVDDDDADGEIDAADQIVNGVADAQDLAIAHITLLPEQLAMTREKLTLSIELNLEARTAVNVFQQLGDTWQFLDTTHTATLAVPKLDTVDIDQPIHLTLGLEAKQFASAQWSGLARLTVRFGETRLHSQQMDQVIFRVAPWLMLPNSAPTTDLYLGEGFYDNGRMRSQLERLLPTLDVELHRYKSQTWQEMWAQDMMEIGYQEIPGHPGMHVVLQSNRGIDEFPKTLLGPDVGYITIGEPRFLDQDDELADWFGNLEVTPPLKDYPFGRIYYGKNTRTQISLHPAVVDFLNHQELQFPLWLDTSWLLVKHVDEILSFMPSANQEPYLLINSMDDGLELLQRLQRQGLGAEWIGTDGLTVTDAIAEYSRFRPRIQRILAQDIIQKARREFGIQPDHIVALPAVMTSARNATTLWSNSVNSVFINGTLVVGDPHGPLQNGVDAIAQELHQILDKTGVRLAFVDDSPYQINSGNVHCATNTKRQPLRPHFWDDLN
jgi:protein-arginine deiminase